jgi:hypothetical protein
MDLALL